MSACTGRLRRLVGFLAIIASASITDGSSAQDHSQKGDDLLKEQRERIKIEGQKLTKQVDDVLSKAKAHLMLTKSPTTADLANLNELTDKLREALIQVRDHPDISNEVRNALIDRLQRSLRLLSARIQMNIPGTPRFAFKIPATTPIEKLLPTPPRYPQIVGPLLNDDLAKVPELAFQEPLANKLKPGEGLKQTAHMVAKVNHANQKKRDAYMEALLAQRSDLAGLPFVMGDDCRLSGSRNTEFAIAVNTIRAHMLTAGGLGGLAKRLEAAARLGDPPLESAVSQTQEVQGGMGVVDFAEQIWETYRNACALEDKANAKRDAQAQDEAIRARIAALMQIFGPVGGDHRQRLARYLSTLSHVESTRALAKLAIYADEDDVRKITLTTLKTRRDKDYTDILLAGLRYPLPAVAKRSAEALVVLQRTDLVPRLLEMLEAPDPRLPVTKTVGDESVLTVRELVRVNHQRNCLLCHAPGNAPNQNPEVFTASMPVPGEPIVPAAYYQPESSPDILVRVDVTYLRQDFSVSLPVANAAPWPEVQRFDFLVRSRTVSVDEAKSYREKLTPTEPGVRSPYHRAALYALRELTSRDTVPTAEAWRQLLKLPAK